LSKKAKIEAEPEVAYVLLRSGIVELLESARRGAARTVNAIITSAYWEIGRRIVQEEQNGREKAGYGERLIDRLSSDLITRFGRGFSRSNVFQMRQFYLAHVEIIQTASGQSKTAGIVQTLPGQLQKLPIFPLSWSHYVRLLTVQGRTARCFYESEALRGGWSVRQLDRQIASQFYERSKTARRTLVAKSKPDDEISADDHIRDPFVLEFLNLKDEYSESELEDALIEHLEKFLLELGGEFTFIARQKRLRVGDQWYRVDLLLFHRRLRCLILIDLKLGRFTHADAGQMNLYLNYATQHWTIEGENPPIGLILCSERNEAVAHYALGNLANKVLAREYRLNLPAESVLVQELAETRETLQKRISYSVSRRFTTGCCGRTVSKPDLLKRLRLCVERKADSPSRWKH
jgi:predicted nuclease of restriction endonuclease-like (RecB) superfamily